MWHPCLPAPRSWAGGAQVPHPCRQQWAAPVPGVWGPCLCPLPSTRLPVLLLVNGRPLWGAPTSWEPGRIHAARSPPRLFVAASLPLTTPVTLSPGPSLLSLPSPTSELASGPLNCTDLGAGPPCIPHPLATAKGGPEFSSGHLPTAPSTALLCPSWEGKACSSHPKSLPTAQAQLAPRPLSILHPKQQLSFQCCSHATGDYQVSLGEFPSSSCPDPNHLPRPVSRSPPPGSLPRPPTRASPCCLTSVHGRPDPLIALDIVHLVSPISGTSWPHVGPKAPSMDGAGTSLFSTAPC